MAMLAERKQKQKWTLNPRGKYWSEDANKFGQKMLEKMGWSSGKGLGANEDGITEHIKQSYKNDSKGIGFEDKSDQWTKHETNFSSLLENLGNADTDIKKPEISLEMKSQSSRRRVHYQKFTRGKDLSRYSEKDLANVFGRKTLEKTKELSVEDKPEEEISSDRNFGVQTVSGGNMADYFKKKLKMVQSKQTIDELNEERPSFGFGFVPAFNTNTEEETIKVDKIKKKKKTKVVINECFDNQGFTDFDDKPNEISSKVIGTNGYQNLAFDENADTTKKSIKRKFSTIEETSDVSSKKKKLDMEYTDEVSEKKKGKKEKIGIDNPGCTEIFVEAAIEDNGNKERKKKKNEKNGIDNLGSMETINVDDKIEEKIEKKLKKKRKNEENGIDNFGCVENLEVSINVHNVDENEHNSVKKSKKNKNQDGIDNFGCTDNSLDTINVVEDETSATKKSKKKKIKASGIDNFGCTENSVEDLNIIDEGQVTKKSKKKKSKGENGIDNIKCSENLDAITVIEDTNETHADKKSKKNKKINKTNLDEITAVDEQNSTADVETSTKKRKEQGLDNPACTANSIQQNIEETIQSMSNAIDNYQLELENEINERKASTQKDFKKNNKIWVENKKPRWGGNKFSQNKKGAPKKIAVKNIIVGKIKHNFEGTNLEKIAGYGLIR